LAFQFWWGIPHIAAAENRLPVEMMEQALACQLNIKRHPLINPFHFQSCPLPTPSQPTDFQSTSIHLCQAPTLRWRGHTWFAKNE
jgi:hypothetical protein